MLHLKHTALLMAQGATATGAYGWALLKVSMALALICLLAYVLVRAAQGRFGVGRHLGGRGGGELRILDRYPLSPRQALWVVEVGGRVFLIGAGEGGITRLAELDPRTMTPREEQEAGEEGVPVPFGELLERMRRKGGSE